MHVTEFALFPTKLVAIQFDAPEVDAELIRFFDSRAEFHNAFDMHPDSFNLLDLAGECPAIDRLGEQFRQGLKCWLRSERVSGEVKVETVLFSNYSSEGDFTMPHNHNADVVGVYYVRTANHERPYVSVPQPEDEYDYFTPEEGVLVLHDPRFNANMVAVQSNDYAKVFPRPGLMVIFPGYLWHTVTPHYGSFRRLAISANFRLRWAEGARRPRMWTISVDD